MANEESKLDKVKLVKARIPLKTVFTTTPAERKKYIQDVMRYNKGLIAERKAKLAELAKQQIYADDIKSALVDFEKSELEKRGAFLEELKEFEKKSGTEAKITTANYGDKTKGTGQETLDYLKKRLKIDKPPVISKSKSSSSRSSSSRSRSSGIRATTGAVAKKRGSVYAGSTNKSSGIRATTGAVAKKRGSIRTFLNK